MQTVQFKSGAVFWAMHPVVTQSIDHINTIFNQVVGRNLVVTSGRDGSHRTDSRHWKGEAYDARSRDPKGTWKTTPAQQQEFTNRVIAETDMSCVYEDHGTPHFHLQVAKEHR